jgi:hypothetical protein
LEKRDELLNGEIFDTILEEKVVTEAWTNQYNMIKPHSSFGDRTLAPGAYNPRQIVNASMGKKLNLH